MIIQTEGLTKYYGKVQALDQVSLTVNAGEIFGIFGPNGAGKTTAIRVLTGLTRPTAGRVYVCGIDVLRNPIKVREEVSIMVEVPYLYESMTPIRYLKFYGGMAQISKYELLARIDDVVSIVDLGDSMSKKILEMSSGQRQRLELARVLLSDAKVLFLDEPFSMIDIELRKRLRKHFRDWLDEGRSIFFTSHNLIESEYIVDRFAFISNGRITAVGTARDLKRRYLMPLLHLEVSDPISACKVLKDIPGIYSLKLVERGVNIGLTDRANIAKIPKYLVARDIELYEMKGIGTMEDVFDHVV